MTVCFDSFVFKLKRKLHYYKYTIILCLLTKYSVGWFRWVCLLCFVVFVEFRWVVSPFRWVCFVVFRWVCFVVFRLVCFAVFRWVCFAVFRWVCFAVFRWVCFVVFVVQRKSKHRRRQQKSRMEIFKL